MWVNHANEYIKEKNGNKYLVFDTTDEQQMKIKSCKKKYKDAWNGIKNKIYSGECD